MHLTSLAIISNLEKNAGYYFPISSGGRSEVAQLIERLIDWGSNNLSASLPCVQDTLSAAHYWFNLVRQESVSSESLCCVLEQNNLSAA